jgi:hypothetical protein
MSIDTYNEVVGDWQDKNDLPAVGPKGGIGGMGIPAEWVGDLSSVDVEYGMRLDMTLAQADQELKAIAARCGIPSPPKSIFKWDYRRKAWQLCLRKSNGKK